MDTKLRKFSRHWYIKFAAYLLILCLSAGFVIAGVTLASKVSDPSAFESKTYADSSACSDELARVVNNLMVLQYDYVSEENIKSGGAVDEYELYSTMHNSNAFLRYQDAFYANSPAAVNNADEAPTVVPEVSIAIMQAYPDSDLFMDDVFVSYLAENPLAVEAARKAVIDEQLRNFTRVKTFLNSVKGQYAYTTYRAESDTAVKTTEESNVKAMPIYATYDIVSESIVVYKNGQAQDSYGYNYYNRYGTRTSDDSFRVGVNDKLLVGIEPEYLTQREKDWQSDHGIASDCIAVMVCAVFGALVLLIYLCVVTGRIPEDNEVHLSWLDRVFSEVHLTVFISLCFMFVVTMDALDRQTLTGMWPMFIAEACLITGVGVPLVLSLIRSIKARRFIRSFAIGRLAIRLGGATIRTVRSMWGSGSMMGRGIALAVLIPLVCMAWAPTPFVIAGCVYFVYRTVKRFQSLQKGVQEVRQGNLDYKIDVKGGDLGALAADINTLSEGLETAISSEVRAERLKTELISNVSHDIKTPLTSIVTYVDLLKTELMKEMPDMAAVREYSDVIDRKTARLRVLTTDLFEAAKATSGAMNVDLEQVDVLALVRQGLGEFADKLSAAQLDVRANVPEKPAHILADGRLVWRILENMLSNVIKYALPGSRVYLDVTTGHGMVTLTMKNISAYELNVPAEELMERFKRGDESRSSEGSGLGLSIAMSLAQLQHGIFTIAVDGDLFKATLAMPAYERHVSLTENDQK